MENNRFNGDHHERALAFKNLIGRAGRLTENKIFDYGYVYTTNAELFSERINTKFTLSEKSALDNPEDGVYEGDDKELIDAINNNTFDDDKNIPNSKVKRLSDPAVLLAAKQFLEIFYRFPDDLKRSIGGAANKNNRDNAKIALKTIYQGSIGRMLNGGETSVFDQATDIFFHAAQGRSFSEIVGLRFSTITNRDKPNEPFANFSQRATKLPDSSLNLYGLFERETPNRNVSYDSIVYDTYDYMDQVISFSLSDTLIAAFKIYGEKNTDPRAEKIVELFRYNTNNKIHILLLRYGFSPEIIKEVVLHIDSIDENKITFKPSITTAPDLIKNMVRWYLPD